MKDIYCRILKASTLFENIDEKYYPKALKLLNNKIKKYDKGETIIHFGENITQVGIVIEGEIEASFLNEGYDEVTMNRFYPGDMFGEAYACISELKSPIEVNALDDCLILFLDLNSLFVSKKSKMQEQLLFNLINSLAKKNAFLNFKVRLFSQKNMRDKIIMYISSLPMDNNGYYRFNMNQNQFANYLNVNRSALARELSNMKKENIIDIDKNKIKLNK